jgi:hypothetical protein
MTAKAIIMYTLYVHIIIERRISVNRRTRTSRKNETVQKAILFIVILILGLGIVVWGFNIFTDSSILFSLLNTLGIGLVVFSITGLLSLWRVFHDNTIKEGIDEIAVIVKSSNLIAEKGLVDIHDDYSDACTVSIDYLNDNAIDDIKKFDILCYSAKGYSDILNPATGLLENEIKQILSINENLILRIMAVDKSKQDENHPEQQEHMENLYESINKTVETYPELKNKIKFRVLPYRPHLQFRIIGNKLFISGRTIFNQRGRAVDQPSSSLEYINVIGNDKCEYKICRNEFNNLWDRVAVKP